MKNVQLQQAACETIIDRGTQSKKFGDHHHPTA